jgi:hypothetical protein
MQHEMRILGLLENDLRIAPMPDQRVRGLGPFLGKSNAPRAHCAGGKNDRAADQEKRTPAQTA